MAVIRLSARQWASYHRGLAGTVTQRLARRREQLIVTHIPIVERIARKASHLFARHLELRDLVQAGCIGLIQAADRYQSKYGSFERFAYLRVRGAVIDAHRRQAYREELHDSIEGIQERLGFMPGHLAEDPAPRPDELAAKSERAARLRAAVAELPAEEREVLGRALAGELAGAIAASHGHSANWARVRLHAAREKVSARLKEAA